MEEKTKEGKTRVRPWEQYRRTHDYLLLEPGWAGVVDDDELAIIQGTLQQDPALSFTWGFRPGQKRRSAVGIRRVAEHGDRLHEHLSRRARPGVYNEASETGGLEDGE